MGSAWSKKHSVEAYVQEFVNKTADGELFHADYSSVSTGTYRTELDQREKNEREEWSKKRLELLKQYKLPYGEITTIEELLCFRVAPPDLALVGLASRSTTSDKRVRRYPWQVVYWSNFGGKVCDFKPKGVIGSGSEKEVIIRDPLHYSLSDSTMRTNESQEMLYVVNWVLRPLEQARLLNHAERPLRAGLLGRPDHCLLDDERNFVAPIEFKTTHNLLLPPLGDDLVRRYDKAITLMTRERTRHDPFCGNIAHPVAQIVSYMCASKRRYGVLSSGTRTYFVRVNTAADNRIEISDAWLLGQKDYLRAWAYLYQLAKEASDWDPPRYWCDETPTKSPLKDGQDGGQCQGEARKRKRSEQDAPTPDSRLRANEYSS